MSTVETKPAPLVSPVAPELSPAGVAGTTVSTADMYREGSECCRNYSKLTMQVRTLSAYLMIAYAVGMGTMVSQVLSKAPPPAGSGFANMIRSLPPQFALAMLLTGLALILFAISLWIVNWHYSTAFRVIRNAIAQFEPVNPAAVGISPDGGPWQGHRRVRTNQKDFWAWNFPFIALGLLGSLSIGLGIWIIA